MTDQLVPPPPSPDPAPPARPEGASPHAPTRDVGASVSWRLPRFGRDPEDRIVGGVAAGLARALGVNPAIVRALLVTLTFAGGVGLAVYAVAWAMADEDGLAEAAPEATPQQLVGLAVIAFGALLLLRSLGMWFGDQLVWPIALAACGSSVVWSRAGLDQRLSVTRPSTARAVAGGALVLAGMLWVLIANIGFRDLGGAILAVTVAIAGVALVFGPWLTTLVAQMRDERSERIRTQARAEMAAHLHDSVLQSLALIQRAGDRPTRMVTIARRQERELRAWLYGQGDARDGGPPATLEGAVDTIVSDVEEHYEVTVDAVVVGQAAVDERVADLLKAMREAMVNAARHSGETAVSVYVEREGDLLEVFVRDRGRGFDPTAVDPQHRGVSDSIHGRLARLGGRARVDTAPGEGTEVHLTLPLHPDTRPVNSNGNGNGATNGPGNGNGEIDDTAPIPNGEHP